MGERKHSRRPWANWHIELLENWRKDTYDATEQLDKALAALSAGHGLEAMYWISEARKRNLVLGHDIERARNNGHPL